MTTFILWRSLQRLYHSHPLFHFVYYRRYRRGTLETPRKPLAWPTLGFEGALGKAFGSIAIILFICAGGWLFLIPLVVVLPAAMFLVGTLNGVAIATGISGVIIREQQKGRALPIAVTPSGPFGMNWAICSAIYHSKTILGRFRFSISSIYQALYVANIGFILVLGGNWIIRRLRGLPPEANDIHLVNSLIILIIVVAFHFDFIQSILLSILIGSIIPTYTRSQGDARGLSLIVFLAVQMMMYSTLFLVCFIFLPAILDLLSFRDRLSISVARLVIFIGAREIVLLALWGHLAQRLEVNRAELNTILRNV